ncbi:MAG: hypothetical protein GX409_06645, partial [candidate division Zixibacteria bacterium]|nr:hypothetical protein [candidate division Zixibacteria bacterium]
MEEEPILPWNNAFKLCSWLCGNVDDCEDLGEHSCDPCPFVSHQFLTWDLVDTIGGRGVLIIEFAGQERYSQTFDFTAGTNEPGVPTNIGVAFLNKDSGPMSPADVHDPQEAFGIIISVDWWGTPFETYSASIKSRNLNDSIIVSCRMIGRIGMRAYYIKMLPAGSLSSIYGDFSGVPPCYNPDILTAKAVGYECDEEIPHQDDEARFGNIPLYVTSLSFLNDFSLYEDSILGTTDPPPYKEILIEDPVWVLNPPRNKSAFYQRNSRPSITLEIKAQCNIAHSLDYQTIGIPSTPYPINKYCTTIDSGRIVGYVDTISGITLQYANFPDSVGIIDSLRYHWMYRKSLIGGAQGFRPMSTTGPHKIYLSYDVPRLDTVNELGLKYICNYARDLNDSLKIFESNIMRIYKEKWEYKPWDTIVVKPLDMLRRKKIHGQCGDYANLATYFGNAVGLLSNTSIVFNGKDSGYYLYYYKWIYSGDMLETNLLSRKLRACNKENKIWSFDYHAVTSYGEYLGDPVFGLVKKRPEYDAWWLYYVYPHPFGNPPYLFEDREPPPFPPYYY